MSRKGLAFFAAFILAGSFVLTGVVGLGASALSLPEPTATPDSSFPASTKIPYFTYAPVDAVVNIPDTKLKAALHTITGIPAQTPIYRSDLAKLGGGLDLSGKGIAKADGLQYCENITDLNLSNNKLTDLPSTFNKLTSLQNLVADDNKLTKIPDVVYQLPKLVALSLKGNDIDKLSDKIGNLTNLTSLDLAANKIDTIPTNIGKLTKLVTLNLARNGSSKKDLTKIPRELCQLPVLETLDLSGNVIGELPKEITTMPKLVSLDVSGNKLDALPAGIGNAPSLVKVDASRNRLTIIEPSLMNGKITDLALDVNRLTDLPQGLSGKTFNTFSFEWNFVDMSDGTDARKIADSVIAPSGKYYLRQLQFVSQPQYQATANTVALHWQALADGTNGDSSWKVNKFQIYQDNGASWKLLAEEDRLAQQYVVTGLKNDKPYKFQIGVEYSLTLNGAKVTHRYFTPVEVQTLNDTAAAAATSSAVITDEPVATETEALPTTSAQQASAAPSAKPASGGGNSTALIVLIVLCALLALGLVGVLALYLGRGKRSF